MDSVIKVEGLYKKFCRSLRRSMYYGSADMFRSMLNIDYDQTSLRKNEFWALQDINFELKRGETLGLIGKNGCGKTTLLRMLNGIFPPDHGVITINGRIGALIAVGAGFHPYMTGRENIFLNGTILGMNKADLRRNLDAIIDFAEIGEFIDSPVSTYSSGMTIRLGFAIAIHCAPDIVLIDEILAVGDAKFQRKCLDKIREMRIGGISIIIVSHNTQSIEAISTKAILIDLGKQIMYGSPQDVIPTYELLLMTNNIIIGHDNDSIMMKEDNSLSLVKKYSGFGTEELIIKKIRLLDKNNIPKIDLLSIELATLEITIVSDKKLDNVFSWISFVYMNNYNGDEGNLVCTGSKNKISINENVNILRFEFDSFQLPTGEYKVAFHIFDETFTLPYTQGHYGYFRIKNEIPTLLRVGVGTPMCWINAKISNSQKQID